jgi:hypothetical protein
MQKYHAPSLVMSGLPLLKRLLTKILHSTSVIREQKEQCDTYRGAGNNFLKQKSLVPGYCSWLPWLLVLCLVSARSDLCLPPICAYIANNTQRLVYQYWNYWYQPYPTDATFCNALCWGCLVARRLFFPRKSKASPHPIHFLLFKL